MVTLDTPTFYAHVQRIRHIESPKLIAPEYLEKVIFGRYLLTIQAAPVVTLLGSDNVSIELGYTYTDEVQ